jgi:hypothetical protein
LSVFDLKKKDDSLLLSGKSVIGPVVIVFPVTIAVLARQVVIAVRKWPHGRHRPLPLPAPRNLVLIRVLAIVLRVVLRHPDRP